MSHDIYFSNRMLLKTPKGRRIINEIHYVSIIKAIMYVMFWTRHDVAYVLGVISIFPG